METPSPVLDYWTAEVDPCCRCGSATPDVLCSDTKVLPFVGAASPVAMVIGQDPTLGARPSTNVAMEMDGDGVFRHFIVEEILRPLGLGADRAYVTDLVKCRFIDTPRQLARTRGCSMTEIIRPAALICRQHLEWELLTINPRVVITLGAPVFELLAEFGGLPSLPPLKDAVAQVRPISRVGRERLWVPCVHWNTLHSPGRKEHYVRLQPARLRAARSSLSQHVSE